MKQTHTDSITIDRKLMATLAISVPKHNHEGIVRYILTGITPGGFLRAVIDNDLSECVRYGDYENLNALVDMVRWFQYEAPAACWGSKEARERWESHSGFSGLGAGNGNSRS